MSGDSYDVIVVGGGACGAIAAWRLAEAKARVLLLEAGERGPDRVQLVGHYAAAAIKSPGSPYGGRLGDQRAPSPESDGAYYEQSGRDLFKSTYLRRLGGTTWHFLGNVPRHVPNDFRLNSAYGVGVDWPIGYDDLEADYCEAEALLGASGSHEEWDGLFGARRSRPFPMSEIWQSASDRHVTPHLNRLTVEGSKIQVRLTPQARNSRPYDGRPACEGNSSCVPICPVQAKYDGTVHTAKAEKAGAEIRTESVVTDLHPEADGTRITEVRFKTWDNVAHSARARFVVLAAHAIEGPKLLLLSNDRKGIANASDWVGRGLMDHLQGAAAVELPVPVFTFRGPPTTSGIDAFRDGPFRRNFAAFRMSLGNDGFGRSIEAPGSLIHDWVAKEGLAGRALRDRIARTFPRQFRISFSAEVPPDPGNRVELSAKTDSLGIPQPKITFNVPEYTRASFPRIYRILDTLLKPLSADSPLHQQEEYTGAGHIMGTTRMGRSPKDSVVDPEGRSHDCPNLFMVGSSVFPTAGTANPTLTAVALTLRTVRRVFADLRGES